MKFLLLPLAILLTACTTEGTFKLPGVYRIDIQQGAIIDGDMLARLKPGMDKNQVQFIMGTPPLVDPFHTNRWDYVYTFSKGGHQRKQRHVTLHFEDDKLSHIDGDVVPGPERSDELATKPAKIVEVPIRQYKKRGFFGRLIDKLPSAGAPQAETPDAPLNEEAAAEPDTQVDEGL